MCARGVFVVVVGPPTAGVLCRHPRISSFVDPRIRIFIAYKFLHLDDDGGGDAADDDGDGDAGGDDDDDILILMTTTTITMPMVNVLFKTLSCCSKHFRDMRCLAQAEVAAL